MKYLLDTCICIYWLRGKYNIADKIIEVGPSNCAISEITVAELKYGEEYGRLKGGAKFVDQKLDRLFSSIKVIPITKAIDIYAKEKARLRMSGLIIPEFDLLIGSTAKREKRVMVTENLKDLSHIEDIILENWVQR